MLKPGLVKGHWSYEEDSILERMVLQGCHSWGEVAAHIPGRTCVALVIGDPVRCLEEINLFVLFCP